MSNKTTLLPCPWCGVDMKLHAINYPWADGEPGWNIWHEDMAEAGKRKCPMEMGCYDTREEAIAAWNTRAELGGGNCARCAEDMGRYADSLCDSLKERIAELLRCLENDWHIHASWDGLRKFWCIELTEEGVRLRDAELGSGTCEMDEDIGATQTLLTCSECGYTTRDYSPIFCGGCGARIRKAVER